MCPSRSVAIEYSNVCLAKTQSAASKASAASRRRHVVDAIDTELAIAAAQRVRRKEEVGKSRAVRRQIVHRGLARGRDEFGRNGAGRITAFT